MARLAELTERLERNERALDFCRWVACLAAGDGSRMEAARLFEQRARNSKHLSLIQKAAAGTIGEDGSPPNWGGVLGAPRYLASAFVELIRPLTVLGRLQGVRRAPFNILVPRAVGGTLVNWVGQAASKPVGEMEFDHIFMKVTKLAGLTVLTRDLVRLADPAAEQLVAADLASAVSLLVDRTFVSDDAAVDGVSPAGILNGATEVPSTGSSASEVEADVQNLLDAITVPLRNPYIIMAPATAIYLASLRDTNGARVFPTVNAQGGDLFGIPVITSANAVDVIAFVDAAYVLLADDGDVNVRVATSATLDMMGGDSPAFSLFQKNCVAVLAERYVNWELTNGGAVSYISGAAFGGSPA
jgi:HK97 family phage major capsid protein